MVVTIISNNLILYFMTFIVCTFLLLKFKKDFNQEGLLDYIIYLTTKIILFIIGFSSLLVAVILLITPTYNIIGFTSQVLKMVLIYAFFNYGLMYFIKFWIFVKEFIEKNDLLNTKLIKDSGGLNK